MGDQENTIDVKDQRAIRIAKLNKLIDAGINPYPAEIDSDRDQISSVRAKFDELKRITDDKGQVTKHGSIVYLAGRIMALRYHGKSMFGTICDGSGEFQLYFRKNILEENMTDFKEPFEMAKDLDIGDFIAARGEVFSTHTGEPTLLVNSWQLISKTLLPLPEKYHGLTDPDLRIRQRYLDLIANPEVKSNFMKRAIIVRTIRNYLEDQGYVEIETPALTPLYGGAAARPFITHHNALDMKLYLRIATELYLKRLIVGGFEKVYELGKVFRNEGLDRDHNPEFTLLELYEAYSDYRGMMAISEGIVMSCAKAVAEFVAQNDDESEEKYIRIKGENAVEIDYEDETIVIEPPFEKMPYMELLEKYTGIDFSEENIEKAKDYLKENKIEFEKTASYWDLIDKIFSEAVEPNLKQPVFVIDYPLAISPLAKRKPGHENITERFELFMFSREMANAFSELNDPLDQRERMEKQMENMQEWQIGDKILDEDFLTALEHGMPPTGGLGIGVGRLVTILSGVHALKEIIAFPLYKPKPQEDQA